MQPVPHTLCKNLLLLLSIASLGLVSTRVFAVEQGDDNPTGVAGTFNGNITTAGSYDPYTANMSRQIDDIVVPGAVGAYPLKWTRYWNSHVTWQQSPTGDSGTGGQWRFSYIDYKTLTGGSRDLTTPDGRIIENGWGVEEYSDANGLHLADGGTVTFRTVLLMQSSIRTGRRRQ